MSFNFEKLTVYQRAMEFCNRIYSLTKKYPKDELFGLVSQLRRAVISISLNIAEGSARTKKDFGRFIDIARGSVYECLAILQISIKQNYIQQIEFDEAEKDLTELSKMLSGLKKSFNLKSKNSEL